MPEDQVKQTKLIVLISVTMFLAIISIICLIFIMKIRSDPGMVKNLNPQEQTIKETTPSTKEEIEEEEVKKKATNPKEVTFEEDLMEIKKDTLDKIQESYDEYELDDL